MPTPPKQPPKRGRPPHVAETMRRVNLPLRLPRWQVEWLASRDETPADLIELALVRTYRLTAPK